MEETTKKISDIKTQLRLFMNGMMAQNLRERGLKYHLIFGIELPRLKEIAADYAPDHDLAQALWKEDIRECRILAGLLQPTESFFPEIADIWLTQMHDTEIIDFTCLNLFRRLSYASEKAFEWMASDDVLTQYAGFRLMCHLLSQPDAQLNERSRDEFVDQANAAIASGNGLLKPVAVAAMEKLDEKSC